MSFTNKDWNKTPSFNGLLSGLGSLQFLLRKKLAYEQIPEKLQFITYVITTIMQTPCCKPLAYSKTTCVPDRTMSSHACSKATFQYQNMISSAIARFYLLRYHVIWLNEICQILIHITYWLWRNIFRIIAQVHRLSALHCQVTRYSQRVSGYLTRYSVWANEIAFDKKSANQIVSFNSC